MSAPSSSPRGERAGTPGAGWETELRTLGEQYVPNGQPEPRANRATRRAAARARKRSDGRQTPRLRPGGPQEAREGASAPVSRPNSPPAAPSPERRENGAQGLDVTLPTRTEIQ